MKPITGFQRATYGKKAIKIFLKQLTMDWWVFKIFFIYKMFINFFILKTPLKITNVCDTRWLSIEVSVSRILDQWLELKTHFNIAKNYENCHMAEKLSDLFDENHYLYLIFLRPILNDLQILNKNFQSSKSDPTKLLNDLEYVIYKLKKFVIVDEHVDILKDDFEKFIVDNCYLGYNFENRLNSALAENLLDCDEASIIRKTCVSFIANLMKELISR